MKNKKLLGVYLDDELQKKVNDFCVKNNLSSSDFLRQAIIFFFEKETSKTDYLSFISDKLFILNYMQVLALSKTDKNTPALNEQAIKKLAEIKDEFSKK
jgi:hypothetical protein